MTVGGGNIDLPSPEEPILPEEEMAVIDKLARKVVQIGMTVPAILFLESVKPLNYIGAQGMVFFEPIVQTIFNFRDYDTLRLALEKRESIEIIIQKIEEHDAVAQRKEKAVKKYMKRVKKTWPWYQRLGFFPPKVDIPQEVLDGSYDPEKPPPPEDFNPLISNK